jgi:hypothetical protein
MFYIELYYFCTSRKLKKKGVTRVKFVEVRRLQVGNMMFNNHICRNCNFDNKKAKCL